MNASVKRVIKDWVPPVLLRAARTWSPVGGGIRFRAGFASWDEARTASGGYDDAAILDKVRAATLAVKRGDAVYERDSVLFDRVEYSWPVLAALTWTASLHGGRLSVLDFGGSLGSSYFQNRRFLARLPDVRWGVVEQPHYVAAGRADVAHGGLSFFDDVEQCAAAIQPNVALLSSVIQYLDAYEPVVARIAAVRPTTIVLDRTIVKLGADARSDIYVQDVPPSIYSASYPVRAIPEQGLIAALARGGYELMSDFDSPEFPPLAALGCVFKGYVFARSG